MSGQNRNALINTSFRFIGEKESGSTIPMNRIVFVGQSATVTLPVGGSILEAGVLQKVNRVFSMEDAC